MPKQFLTILAGFPNSPKCPQFAWLADQPAAFFDNGECAVEQAVRAMLQICSEKTADFVSADGLFFEKMDSAMKIDQRPFRCPVSTLR